MYNSLKAWINVPYTRHPFIRRDGTGSIEYGQEVFEKCYPAGKITTVTNEKGAEVVSALQLYVDGVSSIGLSDLVHFGGKDYPIKSISIFYRNGSPDIKVVYL